MRGVWLLTAALAALSQPTLADEFYCQHPAFVWLSVNASSGRMSEVADDVPRAFDGMPFNQVKLWIAEWNAPWQEPTAVRIQIYNANCPPELVPAVSYQVPWANVVKTLYTFNPPFPGVVYEAVVPLPQAAMVGGHTSIGVQVVNSWGSGPPNLGVMMSDEIFGCFFWADMPLDGFPRWSHMPFDYDLAYCLGMATTSVPEAVEPATWGSIKAAFH
jgi:hypothetical protein